MKRVIIRLDRMIQTPSSIAPIKSANDSSGASHDCGGCDSGLHSTPHVIIRLDRMIQASVWIARSSRAMTGTIVRGISYPSLWRPTAASDVTAAMAAITAPET